MREAWSSKIGRLLGMPLARLLADSRFDINPNVITILTIPVSVLAGICFFYNLLIIGAIFYFINWTLDNTDGSLARMTNKTSTFGDTLDNYTDRINTFIMFFGLWYSQFYLNDMWLVGGLLIGIHYALMLVGVLFINYKYKTIFKTITSYYHPNDEAFITFFFLPIFGIFIIGYPVVIILQLISTSILFTRRRKK